MQAPCKLPALMGVALRNAVYYEMMPLRQANADNMQQVCGRRESSGCGACGGVTCVVLLQALSLARLVQAF